MSGDIQIALEGIRGYTPVPWDQIPDLGLYMDQIVTFITRMYAPLYGQDIHGYLSAAMINNYVKARLVPRPVGKKYSRDQIALLAMIVVLKQTSSMEDIRRMLALKPGETVEALYGAFTQRFSRALRAVCGDASAFSAPGSALDFAILASCAAIGCASTLKRAEEVH